MLIFTRKEGEAFMVGRDITITLLSSRKGLVRIGIDAPKDVIVHREEILQRIIDEENEQKEKK